MLGGSRYLGSGASVTRHASETQFFREFLPKSTGVVTRNSNYCHADDMSTTRPDALGNKLLRGPKTRSCQFVV